MEEIATGFAVIKEAILGRHDTVRETPERSESDVEDNRIHYNYGLIVNTRCNHNFQPTSTKDQASSEQQVAEEENSQPETTSRVVLPSSEPVESAETEIPWELDADALRILGEELVQEEPRLVLLSSVVNRWKKYFVEGLKKEVRESLLSKYPRKGKF
ncbi:PREDICTED: uncharacterized protein LOC107066991 [Polistes dominula]|uniref:Uncharacterized protein LOC107066991 n=1 Tax=Polistes dominula TaxID=743375 RepID=A0ABM1IBJ5_POLDO|nr:PREDICTED: uncharacterized protein LOC107066991 [Polistes dominula]